MRRRYSRGLCEHATPRTSFVGGTLHVTRPKPAPHEVRQYVYSHPVLQQVRSSDRSGDTPARCCKKVTLAEPHLWSRTRIAPERVGLTRGAIARGKEDLQGNGVAQSLNRKRGRLLGSATCTCRTTRASRSPVDSFTGDVPQRAQRRNSGRGKISSEWPLEEGQVGSVRASHGNRTDNPSAVVLGNRSGRGTHYHCQLKIL